METDKNIGIIIKKWIKNDGRSQSSVAQELGISQQNFNHQLRGSRPMPKERINLLIAIFNPPKKDVEKIFSYFAQRGATGLKLSPTIKIGLKVEAERQAMLYSSDDGLLIEFLKVWKTFNRAQKLKILTYTNELETNPKD